MTWPNYSAACRKDVDELLKRGGSLSAYRANAQVGSGPTRDTWAWRLEREIEAKFHVKHAVACNSGTGALHAAIVATAAISRSSAREIIVSPYTFSASAAAILHAGFTPVFADVDPYTFCTTPETVKPVLTKRTAAILPVSIFGGMADVHGLIKAFGLPVIEDACQAVGAKNSSGYSGSQAAVAAYSMNGAKNVPAGECGAMVTHWDKAAEQARLLMNHGENFGQSTVGYNYRPNELTCCVAWHGLQELEERNKRRIALANRLLDTMDTTWKYFRCPFWPTETPYKAPPWPLDGSHVFYVLALVLERGVGRDRFIKRMKQRGIHVGAGYIQPPLHHYKAFRKYASRELPVVDDLSFKTLCLLYDLTPDKPLSYADHVAQAMRESL